MTTLRGSIQYAALEIFHYQINKLFVECFSVASDHLTIRDDRFLITFESRTLSCFFIYFLIWLISTYFPWGHCHNFFTSWFYNHSIVYKKWVSIFFFTDLQYSWLLQVTSGMSPAFNLYGCTLIGKNEFLVHCNYSKDTAISIFVVQ